MDDGQPSLFGGDKPSGSANSASSDGYQPLARRMRPQRLDAIIGQTHLLGDDCLLPRLIRQNQFGSLLFYGPPGCGKTTLADVIASEVGGKFIRVNAVMSNVAELRDILKLARYEPQQRTILFIDEIHRFNKAQQDLLLPDVEAGHIRLIGATTHNPGFYVIPALLSRSHLFKLEPLTTADIKTVLKRAVADTRHGLGNMRVTVDEAVFDGLAQLCDGDLRRGLNALETLVQSVPLGTCVTEDTLVTFAQERHIRYDKNEDEHYDTISAFIKSVRGSDPDAALYWLAKMLLGGEDPRFLARRLIILASEDIGLADSRALPLATATWYACESVGLPECELNLAHCTIFLACCPKSNSATLGLASAKAAIRKGPLQAVPLWLRDSHTKFNKSLGQGAAYEYSHDFPGHISPQAYMETPQTFYQPSEYGAEAQTKSRLEHFKQLRQQAQRNAPRS